MGPGTYAEYVCLPEESGIVIKPTNMTYDEAAAIPFSAYTALFFLRDTAKVQPGQKVLINGASGAVGVAAIQIARHFGAEVTGVCSNTNLELVKSLGADKVIDYTKEDFAEREERYDFVFDAVIKLSKSNCKKLLAPRGKFGQAGDTGKARPRAEDLDFLKDLIEVLR